MENLTKYEEARIIGTRALQISMGAPFMLKFTEKEMENMRYSPIEIAKLEFKEGLIPISIRRPMPQQRKRAQPSRYIDQTKLE